MKRALPRSENMDRNLDEKTLFELNKDKMKPVVALLDLVEDPQTEDRTLKVVDILHLLCKNFAPDGPDKLDVTFICSHKEHAVSPLGFLFLEHLEDLVGPTELTVEEIFVGKLEEPLLSPLSYAVMNVVEEKENLTSLDGRWLID